MTIRREAIQAFRFGRDDEGRLVEKHDKHLILVEQRPSNVKSHIMCRYLSEANEKYYYTSDYPRELLHKRMSVREVTRFVNCEAFNYLQTKV